MHEITVTEEGLKKLTDELNYLKTEKKQENEGWRKNFYPAGRRASLSRLSKEGRGTCPGIGW